MWAYRQVTNPQVGTDRVLTVFEVGIYLGSGYFETVEQYDNRSDARKAVHYLNGGEYL